VKNASTDGQKKKTNVPLVLKKSIATYLSVKCKT